MHKNRLDDANVLVAFELPTAVHADTVSLVGDFNGWSPDATPLARQDDGRFRVELTLPVGGRSRFRYLLDGHRWENDWAADDYAPNGLGSEDSVVDLTDAVLAPRALAAAAPVVEPPTVTDAIPGPGSADREESVEPVESGSARRPWFRFWKAAVR